MRSQFDLCRLPYCAFRSPTPKSRHGECHQQQRKPVPMTHGMPDCQKHALLQLGREIDKTHRGSVRCSNYRTTHVDPRTPAFFLW